jgi:hypothetical protein
MRLVFLFVLLAAAAAPALASDTAYHALRTLGAARGEKILNQVIEVQGRDGTPQPETWTVTVDDPMARGGVRVFEIRNGRVTSERAPVSRTAGQPVVMDFNKLNLDSSGAFTVAEQEAVRARIGFDGADYVLRSDETRGVPVWVVQLLDRDHRPVGKIQIAADNGLVLQTGHFQQGLAEENGRYEDRDFRDRDYRDRRYVSDDIPDEQDEPNDGVLGSMKRFGKRVERHFRRDAATLEQFFTGRRTLDRNDE